MCVCVGVVVLVCVYFVVWCVCVCGCKTLMRRYNGLVPLGKFYGMEE